MSPDDDASNDDAPASTPAIRLDVALVLKRSAQAMAQDFPAMLLAGLALVMLPALAARGIAGGDFGIAGGDFGIAGGDDLGTLLTTLRGVGAMLYVALVSWGLVSRLYGRALSPAKFLREGLARAKPGLQVALLAGAAVVAALTIQLFARPGTLAGWILDALLLAGGLLAICMLMPLVPVAVVERLGPLAAFRRAAALTEGNRNRILVVALVVVLTLAPAAALVAGVAGDTGPWLKILFELLAWSLAATVPAMVYAGLRGGL